MEYKCHPKTFQLYMIYSTFNGNKQMGGKNLNCHLLCVSAVGGPFNFSPCSQYFCLYFHTYIHIYIYTYIHTYLHTYMYIYTHIYIHIYRYIHTAVVHVCTYIHTYITFIHSCDEESLWLPHSPTISNEDLSCATNMLVTL